MDEKWNEAFKADNDSDSLLRILLSKAKKYHSFLFDATAPQHSSMEQDYV